MQILRMDRSVMENVALFDMAYPDDATLVKHVIYALAYDLQLGVFPETLWGLKQIEPLKLAPIIGMSRKHLVNPASHPVQFEGLTSEQVIERKSRILESNDVLWNTKLCNAIWILRSKRDFDTTGWEIDKGLRFSKIVERGFVSKAQKYQSSTGRRKTIYEVEINESFKNNIASYFSRYDHDLLISMDISLRNLYLSLVTLRETMGAKAFHNAQQRGEQYREMGVQMTPYLPLLKLWANATQKTDRFNKSYISSKVDKINSYAGWEMIELTWRGYDAEILFKYSEEEIELRSKERDDRLKVFLLDNLKTLFRSRYSPAGNQSVDDYNHRIRLWLTNQDKDYSDKDAVIRRTLIQVYGRNHTQSDNAVYRTFQILPELAELIPRKSTVVEVKNDTWLNTE